MDSLRQVAFCIFVPFLPSPDFRQPSFLFRICSHAPLVMFPKQFFFVFSATFYGSSYPGLSFFLEITDIYLVKAAKQKCETTRGGYQIVKFTVQFHFGIMWHKFVISEFSTNLRSLIWLLMMDWSKRGNINIAALVTVVQCNILVARCSRQLIGPADWVFVTLGPLRCD